MCEWLSSDDWSDVQLLCSGHIFSAHRVVLASVSSFLRNVLLSCPSKDSPACIILPDFDLSAMSCVLHYIYHGEVVIPQCSLSMFLDIVQTMQIYVDPQYLYKSNDDTEKSYFDLNMDCVRNLSKSENEQIVKLKEGVQLKHFLCKVHSTFHGLDFRDGQCPPFSWSEKSTSTDGDVKSRCKDRQKSSTLRDLYIETCAQSGNGNGVAASVLAISNERYRGPTSVLFTNANGRHPSASYTLSESSKITSDLRCYRIPPPCNVQQAHDSLYLPLNNDRSEAITELVEKNKMWVKSLVDKNDMDYCLKSLHGPFNINECSLFANESSSLDLRILPSRSEPLVYKLRKFNIEMKESFKNVSIEGSASVNNNIYLGAPHVLHKEIILNQVLRNPWCPQLPYYFKPFRRKTALHGGDKSQCDLGNDKNNNVNLLIPPLNSVQITKKLSNSETKDASVTSHSVRLSDINELKCATCNKVFTSSDSLMTHMLRHSTATRYSCGECCKTFSQLRNYKYHMSVHRGTSEFATTCPVCGKYFNDRGYLSSHMKIHRNRKEYKCSVCPKSFNQRVAYNMHVRIHTGVKPHVCGECGKAFSRKMLLTQHQRTHSGERPYACTHCDKRFADRSNMTLHSRLHTGVKPYSCSICSKSFTKKHHLKSHLNFHTGVKPYSCPRCQLAFTQSSNMRTHFKKCSAPEASPSSAGSS